MIKSKKQMFIVIGAFALVLLLGTTTYAFFNYTRTGASNTIKVGRINFISKNEQTITLNNLFPIDPSNSTDMNDNTKVGTYSLTIEGDTDYSGGIEYLVSVANSSLSNLPISINMTVGSGLGTSDTNYFTSRDTATTPIYKKIIGSEITGDQMLLVGYIPQNTTLGTSDETGDAITIKAYLDKNKILVSDTYDGTESDSMGTPNSLAEGKTVLTTTEWNALSSTGVSFKVKVEANEGIWVKGSLEEIMKTNNIGIDTENGVDFSKTSDQDGLNGTGTKGVYMRAGTQNDMYPILYYRGAVDNNNVVFANKCWKAVRTTDTGGVKLIYNGESSAVYDEVPLTESQYTIPSGATNNFTFNQADNSWEITITDNTAKEISFTVPAGDGYKIVQTGTSGSSTGGNWTFYKDGTNVKVYGNGGGQPMNDTYTFGTLTASNVIKWTYSGSSSPESPITFKLQMMQQGDLITENWCDNTGVDTHINISGTNMFAFNTSFHSQAYVGYMYGTVYRYSTSNWTSGARFGSGFTWDGTNYKLVDATVTNPDATHHYSCNSSNAEATCTDLRYVYYWSVSSTLNSNTYYITLQNGKSVEDALREMQTNTTNSNAKDKIETWYANNLTSYTSKIEDTIYCNDRSMNTLGDNQLYIDNGWNANGGNLRNYYLHYSPYGRAFRVNSPSLSCANKNDAFTWKNGDGNQKLQYPVGMITSDEVLLAGGQRQGNGAYYLNSGSYYWSLSPFNYYSGYAGGFIVNGSGGLDSTGVGNSNGLRPAISIKQGLPITKGTGTVLDPYIIE